MGKPLPTAETLKDMRASLVVQSICAMWLKETRGARYATARNALPKALAIPDAAVFSSQARRSKSGCWHRVRYTADDLFQSRSESVIEYDPDQYVYGPFTVAGESYSWLRTPVDVPLVLLFAEARMRIELRGLRMPARRDKALFDLEVGQYGRVEFNRRTWLGYDGPWAFEHWVVSIGLFVHPAPDCFVSTTPDRQYIDLARLYYNA